MEKQDILIVYGADPKPMVRQLLEQIRPEAGLRPDASILLKPNLVVAKPAETGATTTPAIVEAVIQYLQEKGLRNLSIVESAWVGDSTQRAYSTCGYSDLSKKYGVPLYDVKKDRYKTFTVDGMSIEVSQRALAADYIISFPVLKGHCQTAVTCALKNMKGLISDRSKRYFHTIGLHRPIAALGTIRTADLVLVDGLNGDLDFEEGGNPVPMHRILAARDSVLVDSYVATLMGYQPEEIAYIPLAARMGVGSMELSRANIVELNADTTRIRTVSGRKVAALAKYIHEDQACSACYGNLIHALARLQDRGELGKLRGKPLCIGQGFRGKQGDGVGIGACCKGFSHTVGGCPPKAVDILAQLEQL